MKNYEQIFILKPSLSADEITTKIASIKDVIINNGGAILGFKDIGMRRLAYQIDRQTRGYFGVFYFTIETNAILELERLFRVSEDVLKFMTITYESKIELKAFADMVDVANGKKIEEKRISGRLPREEDYDDERE